jgi:TonB family protein
MRSQLSRVAIAGLVLCALLGTGVTLAQQDERFEDPVPLTTFDPLISPMVYQGGTVVLRVKVARSGHVEDIEIISGFPALTRPVVESVQQWTFTPAKLRGRAVDATTTVVVHVALQRTIAPPPG